MDISQSLNTQLHHANIPIRILGTISSTHAPLVSVEALTFLHQLHIRFEPKRQDLLKRRQKIQSILDKGTLPSFPSDSAARKDPSWRVAPAPLDLQDRLCEICKPAIDRSEVLGALTCPQASVFIADLDDAHCPSWHNSLEAQLNLHDACTGAIFQQRQGAFKPIKIRPRSWNLDESNLVVMSISSSPKSSASQWQTMSGSLFDFGMYCFHNARLLAARGSGAYFYLCKLESAAEAQLWEEVFTFTESYFSLPRGSLRATVLIENILASFEMPEILYVMKDHCVGLNCGRWDYLFSFLRKLQSRPERCMLGDRSRLTFDALPFLRAYADALVQTCHARGAYATGGMAAILPSPKMTEAQFKAAEAQVKADKMREAETGFDGAIAAHEKFAPVVRSVFEEVINKRSVENRKPIGAAKDQITLCPRRDAASISAADLVAPPASSASCWQVTESGVLGNVRVALYYIQSWLNNDGMLRLDGKVEDAATAEISRVQLWLWIQYGAKVMGASSSGDAVVTVDMISHIVSSLVEQDTQQFAVIMKAPQSTMCAKESAQKAIATLHEARHHLMTLLGSPQLVPFMTNYLYEESVMRPVPRWMTAITPRL